jgi:hypothetical protein
MHPIPVVIGTAGLRSQRGPATHRHGEQAAGIIARLEKLNSPYSTRLSYDAHTGRATASAA